MKSKKNNKKYMSFFTTVVLMVSVSLNIFLLTSYEANKRNESMLAESVASLERDYEELENMTKDGVEKVCETYYEVKLRELLPYEDIQHLARLSWKYSIKINGEELMSPNIKLKDDNLRITFTERLLGNELPKGIIEEERLIQNDEQLKDLLTCEFDREPTDVIEEEVDGSRILTYIFVGLKRGEVVTLRINPTVIEILELRDKINLKDDKIELIKTE